MLSSANELLVFVYFKTFIQRVGPVNGPKSFFEQLTAHRIRTIHMDIGLDCYFSRHNGFCGQLKKSCEDFQVTEIDEFGYLVNLTNQAIPTERTRDRIKGLCTDASVSENHGSCRSYRAKPTSVDKNSSLHPTSKSWYQLSDITSLDTIFEETIEKLTDLLGNNKVTKLQEMASHMQVDVNSLHLGIFNNKNDRATIHLSTRIVFPAIKTETSHQDGKYTITANIDHVFLEFLALFSDKSTVESLMRFCCCIDKNTSASYDLPFCDDKDKRTKIHRLLAKHFGSFLESKTFTPDNSKTSCIQIRMRQKQGPGQGRTQGGPHEKKRGKDVIYTGFVLRKVNMETMEAIERLSRCVGVHPSAFSFAGIKDKKAVTLQKVVVKGITPEQLSVASSDLSLSNITIGSYKPEQRPIEKGQHGGNAFLIIIRNIHLNSTDIGCQDSINEVVKEAVDNVKRHGFINYFGRQRFGQGDGGRTKADEIGLAMIQGDMVKAVRLLLKPSDEQDETNDAKRYYQDTGDIQGTLSRMPRDRTRECLILKSLHRHGQDNDGCTKAFFNIPYSMRLLYAHSYVSLIWNKMVSYRLKEYGTSGVVEGDLVHDWSNPRGSNPSQSSVMENTPPQPDESSRDVSTKANCTRTASSNNRSENEDMIIQANDDRYEKKIHPQDRVGKQCDVGITSSIDKTQIKVVTEEDVRTGKYTIRDLVLPIPGYNVLYPTNRTKERYQELLQKDGLTNKSFRLKSLGMTLPGAYRKVIAVPMDVELKWIDNDRTKVSGEASLENSCTLKTNDSCSLSDRSTKNPTGENKDTYGSFEQHCGSCDKHWKFDDCVSDNLEMSFKLPPSCYATICLREIMKTQSYTSIV